MSLPTVENAIHNVLRTAERFGADLARLQPAVRCTLVDPTMQSLGWRAWAPWGCQPEFTRHRHGYADYALLNRSGEATVAMLVRP